MSSLSYAALKHITNVKSPYRGSTNRYPLGDRKRSHKYFLVDYIDNEEAYRIIYGKRWERVFITPDEMVKYKALGKDVDVNPQDPNKCWYYDVKPNEMGIVRPDNTFEFTMEYLGIGNSGFLNNMMRGLLVRSSRHGGVVYSNRYSSQQHDYAFHPVFKGLRINLESGAVHESSKYRVIGKRVSRKASKDLMKRYELMLKASEAMAKMMESKDFVETVYEVYKEASGVDLLNDASPPYYVDRKSGDTLVQKAEELVESAPLDAMILYGMSLGVESLFPHRIQYSIRKLKNSFSNYFGYMGMSSDPASIIATTKRKLTKHLYMKYPDILVESEREAGKFYTGSEWGFTILVNDREVTQY